MPKKPQGQGPPKRHNEHSIVDEQNDPYIKGLNKRVRNINKTLVEIEELKLKDNLKPEQQKKINRKVELVQEKDSIEESIQSFKAALNENADYYRSLQLKELQSLAKALAVYHTSPHFHEHKKLATLWNGLHTLVEGGTLQNMVESVEVALKAVANDHKLQDAINQFVQENGAKPVELNKEEKAEAEEEPANEVVVMVEELVNEKGEEVGEIDIIETIKDGKVEEIDVVVVTNEPVPEPAQQPEAPKEEAKPEEKKTEEVKQKEDKPPREGRRNRGRKDEEGGERRDKERGERRDREAGERRDRGERRERRDNDGEEGGRRRQDDRERRPYNDRRREDGHKKHFKPKYDEEPRPQKPVQKDDSDSDSEQEARQFRKEEIKKLEDEGFTVVCKKPKANNDRNQARRPYRDNRN